MTRGADDAEQRRDPRDPRRAHKVPAHVWITEEPLPRGDTGKVLKRVIQDTYAPSVATS